MWRKWRLAERAIKEGRKGCKEWNILNQKKQERRIKCTFYERSKSIETGFN
jgi:hypothetical protein